MQGYLYGHIYGNNKNRVDIFIFSFMGAKEMGVGGWHPE